MPEEVAYQFDPWELIGKKRPKKGVAKAKAEVAEAVLQRIFGHMAQGKTPVAGGKWVRQLSEEYRKRKVAKGGASFSDLFLDGDLVNATEIINSGKGLKLRVAGKEAGKADGHNNHSGKSPLPPREFIPKEGQRFNRAVMATIREVLGDFDDG